MTAAPLHTADRAGPTDNAKTSVSSAEPEGKDIHFHVSSQHLQLVSPWFKRAMTKEGWAESKLTNGHYQVRAHDWDEQAFLMVLNIFHLRNKQVPRNVPLEMLAKLAVLVDYYECGEAIELFTAMWINKVKETAIPSSYCRDLILWVWVAWVFDMPEHCQRATAVVMKELKEAMPTLGLPFPNFVSSVVNLRRCQAIESVISDLHNLLDEYRSSKYKCKQNAAFSFQCSSLLLGALTKELDSWSLLSPRPEPPFLDLSFSSICTKIRGVKSLTCFAKINMNGWFYGSGHSCELRTAVVAIVEKAASGVVGLSLDHIRGTSKPSETISSEYISNSYGLGRRYGLDYADDYDEDYRDEYHYHNYDSDY
ncbi:uncharacterized protein EKO05_0007298 [Ascochyta rabiei]|uniref:uncharacterized protein n=1 Tax=Didymella rabiei TaxID=5454 RepID=UPI001900F883|nr:uncharacterized protein EKO05_0007298 [Ascochyta rabiei]UPX16917.1 hypothetical protein EKO05_0007298 [Ascochyta rabiei]